MALKFFDPSRRSSVNQYFRQKRFQFFLQLLDKLPSDRLIKILDVGGSEQFWKHMDFSLRNNVSITVLNLDKPETTLANFSGVAGNACDMRMFADKEFDIVFSNSVIEHLFTGENQKLMADEVRRVGKMYFVQTPNYYFPIEPHWMFPGFQFLPAYVKRQLTSQFNLGHYPKAKNKEEARQRVNEVRLLTARKMKNLFPDGSMYKEKFFGLTKSIISYRM